MMNQCIRITESSEFGYYEYGLIMKYLISLRSKKLLPSTIKKLIIKIGFKKIVDVELDKMKFRCFPFQNYHDLLIVTKEILSHEREEFKFVSERLYPGATFVDIGANSGVFCVFASKSVDDGLQIVAFEPNPVVVERLRYNLKINNIHNQHISQIAVGEDNERRPLWIHPKNLGASSLVPFRKRRLVRQKTILNVQMRPLSEIITNNLVDKIDFLKIDIEGYEDRALIPFFRDVEKKYWPKAILIETCHNTLWQSDCIKYLISKGYNIIYQNEFNKMLDLTST